jgi:WD40-like Beta Propeller Repeat
VSRRTIADVTCGLGDIYFTRFDPAHGWRPPEHLGCAPEGPNTALDEQGPSYVKADGQKLLYFSSSSASVAGDIYVSARGADGTFGPASPVAVLNSAANDIQPNLRKDGREVVFSSNRPDSLGQDIWVSVRDHVDDPWSPPTRLGSEINTAAAETRPSLSRDAERLYFGRAPGPEGMTDIYVSTREKLNGRER